MPGTREAFCQHRNDCRLGLIGKSQEGEVCGPFFVASPNYVIFLVVVIKI